LQRYLFITLSEGLFSFFYSPLLAKEKKRPLGEHACCFATWCTMLGLPSMGEERKAAKK
jgi:hypothetical protein